LREDFVNKLSQRLNQPLPGAEAQLLMGSGVRMKELRFMPENENTKNSAVLILIYPHLDKLYSVLIVRPEYTGTHSGQVSLPGGKFEDSDADLIQTALRETREEIGVDEKHVEVLGQLSRLYIPPSNFVVYPVAGYTNKRPAFVPDPTEVSKIIEFPLSLLLQVETIKTKEFSIRNDFAFTAPYFDILGHVVWGATAMILSEFVEIIKDLHY
jgi:8-oxo-dGTP pyrophosphatase MutT (NUDIX family)